MNYGTLEKDLESNSLESSSMNLCTKLASVIWSPYLETEGGDFA